jgi:hypothetical protein
MGPQAGWIYKALLGGRSANEEKGLQAIPPIFNISFSKEKTYIPETSVELAP